MCWMAAASAEQELEIVVEFLPANCEVKSKKGDTIYWHYTGTLLDGTQFDSSVGRNPYFAKLGAGQVIEGVERSMLDMCVGEKRKLTIPSDLAYGPGGYGTVIPPAATLKFDVELMRIDPAPAAVNYFKLIDADKSNFLSNAEVMKYSLDHYEKEQSENPIEDARKVTDDFFRDNDHNQDGLISFDEFPGPKRDEL